ncbi:hypothetical protein [Pseudomonas viridiflava]|uniref:hypothetical protein n=2 Tax=Pseudomonas viridiflava TaxID=33069 RepID=UPI001F12EDC0|nr:hypothetical protein [Pseudomonas viridiflava]
MIMSANISEKNSAVASWFALLDDSTSLLTSPGVHHKLLVYQAGALRTSQIVSLEEYSDMLELADGALAYAIEAQLDLPLSDSVA